MWLRQMLAEIQNVDLTQDVEICKTRKVAWIIDAKAAFDALSADRNNIEDKRAVLEVALLRQELHDPNKNVEIIWVPTGHQIADGLTKRGSIEVMKYLSEVASSGLWTLGPDHRVPPDTRGHTLVDKFTKDSHLVLKLSPLGSSLKGYRKVAADGSFCVFIR